MKEIVQRHSCEIDESIYPTCTLESGDCPHPPHLKDEKIKDHTGEDLKSLLTSHWQRQVLKREALPFLLTASCSGDFLPPFL